MSESRYRLSRVLCAAVAVGLALTGTAPSASAETDRYTPRIECGPEAPKGKRLHRGKNHIEIESEMKEAHTSRFSGRTYFMVQRYALIKRSNCWVSFWVYQDDLSSEAPFQRATGTFYEVENYEKYWNQATAYRHFGATIEVDRARALLTLVDPEAAACEKKAVQISNSLQGPILGSRLIDRQSQKMTVAARATAERKV
ncbi:hypothetical protein, partial [Gemmobacter denitrificans]